MHQPATFQRHAYLCFKLAIAFALLSGSSNVWADSCLGTSATIGKSADGRFTVIAQHNSKTKQWQFVWTDTKTKRTVRHAMPTIPKHAHLYLFVSGDGSRLAVVRVSAGHDLDDRLMIYQSDGKLVKAFSIKDLLNAQEIGDVQRSISHLQWLFYDGSIGKVDAKTDVLKMKSRQGRVIRVSLPKAKVVTG